MRKILMCNTRYSIVQKLSNKQSAKVICRFDRLTTAHSKRLISHMSIWNLSAAHAFNYIVPRGNPGLTSCEDLATALIVTVKDQKEWTDPLTWVTSQKHENINIKNVYSSYLSVLYTRHHIWSYYVYSNSKN